ncbi:MAG: hypothetical protein AB1746_16410 [Candidatus Zixiibacteriota bacterium]
MSKMRLLLSLIIFCAIAISCLPALAHEACFVGRVQVVPELEPEILRAHAPFTINIYLENVAGYNIPGFIFAPYFYGGNGISAVMSEACSWGNQCCGNVCRNPALDLYFILVSECNCASWDGALPDSFYYFGAGLQGWPADAGEILAFSFSFIVDQEGTFCIDSSMNDLWGPYADYIMECYIQMDFPLCWEVVEAPRTIKVPFDAATIQAAVDIAVDGDTVLLSSGLYFGDGTGILTFGANGLS